MARQALLMLLKRAILEESHVENKELEVGVSRAAKVHSSDLLTRREAASRLRCSVKTLVGHVASGALRYVLIGHGTVHHRRMFTEADLDAFIVNQTRKDVQCHSTKTHVRPIGTSISSGEVIGFSAQQSARLDARRKRPSAPNGRPPKSG
jgi:hypothetical protein